MIVFINGPFGVGKTSVAERLVTRLPDGFLFDPEMVGFFLRAVLTPIDPRDDFQDYPLWRELTVLTARRLWESYGRTLIIPMSIWREDFFHEVLGGLRALPVPVRHVCLTAPAETVYARLRQRGVRPGDWAWQRVEPCVQAFVSPRFDIRLATEGKSVEQVADDVYHVMQGTLE